MAQKTFHSVTDFFKDFGFIILAALLFSFSFPSYISQWGWGPVAFFALIPVFYVIHRSSWPRVILYGFFFGFFAYLLYGYWLVTFHPLAAFIIPPIFAFFFLVLFPLFKLTDKLFPKYGYLVQALIWVAWEYLRTLGFLGYSYGIMGYSQYLFLPFIQIAGLTGIWGVSLLVVFPSVFLGNGLKEGFKGFLPFLKQQRLVLAVYGLLFSLNLVYGFISPVDYSNAREWKVALIQQNSDPWKSGIDPYKHSLDICIRQSKRALKENPDIVIWSETSFVPAIHWHLKYRQETDKYYLVRELLDFLKKQQVPFVIGNDHGELKKITSNERVDYNAALLYDQGSFSQPYRKIHLVPFTEYFPFEKSLPWIYKALKEADTHFWEEGTEYTVFDAGGVKFSTPICFEDTFGYLSRGFVNHGAQVIVNMTNDSWSKTVAAEMQHMGMAVFRAIENRRTMVRSSNGGMTCTIDPNGKITNILEPFVEGYLVATVPVYTGEKTLYTRWGDWFAVLICITVGGIFAVKALVTLVKKK